MNTLVAIAGGANTIVNGAPGLVLDVCVLLLTIGWVCRMVLMSRLRVELGLEALTTVQKLEGTG